jgi:hypothetical protein
MRAAGWKQAEDFHETPSIATEALLGVEKFHGQIWEVACGAGAVSKILEAANYKVLSTDLHARGYGESGVDFLTYDGRWRGAIVSNPPYNLCLPFMEECESVGAEKWCFLLRLACLSGQRRARFYRRCPPIRAHIFSARLPMMHRGGYDGPKSTSTVDFMWLVWERGFTGKTTINLI